MKVYDRGCTNHKAIFKTAENCSVCLQDNLVPRIRQQLLDLALGFARKRQQR
jgi:hypothetical protein